MPDPKDPPYAPPFDGTDGMPVVGGAAERVHISDERLRCSITGEQCSAVEDERQRRRVPSCPCVRCIAWRARGGR